MLTVILIIGVVLGVILGIISAKINRKQSEMQNTLETLGIGKFIIWCKNNSINFNDKDVTADSIIKRYNTYRETGSTIDADKYKQTNKVDSNE